MNAPFRPSKHGRRDYVLDDPDTAFWHRPAPRLTFIEDADADIAADLREFNRLWMAGTIAGLIVSALIWWWQV